MTRGRALTMIVYVVAAFLATMAVLLRYYVYGAGLLLPLEQHRVSHLVDTAATYLDTTTFQVRTRVPIIKTVSWYGDPAADGASTAVWVEFSSLETGYGQRIDYHERRTAFDRRSGLAVACCDAYVDDDSTARQTGLAFRLPYGAEPREYPMFDPVLKREVPLKYERVENVEGLRTYRYSSTVGPAKVEDLPGQVPGKVLGLPGREFVSVTKYVRITRTLWVEPESGLPVRVEERRTDTLRTADQVDRLVSLQADLITDPGDVAAQVAEAGAFRWRAIVIRDVAPIVFLAVALLVLPVTMLVAARVRRRARAGRSAAAQDQQQVPGHDLADTG
ncbi:DUF3068 domain-containing protein [Sphaerisporangium dianthi]|uniref:DUF3068 domain-containing protein n=1 Tax=Sphaerisporangium dianthi TaxID=1436120 RepID=A0ABV9CP23_9ACTN